MLVGGAFLGGVAVDGRIADLRVERVGALAVARWAHAGVTDSQHLLLVAVDGEVQAVLPAGSEEAVLAVEGDGEHRVEVRPLRAEARRIPDLHGDVLGARAWLAWEVDDAADLAAHEVVWDGGTGTLDEVTVLARLGAEATSWTSDELEAGEYLFAVRSVDDAWNASAVAGPVGVVIRRRPAAVENAAVAWDGTHLTLTWEEPPGTDSVRIYSNRSNSFRGAGALREHVLEDGPWKEVASGVETLVETVDAAELGLWRFWVRAVVDGVESLSVEMLEVDTREAPTGVSLNTPGAVEAAAIAAGWIRVSWVYDWEGGEDAEEFDVFVHADPDAPVFTTAVATVAVPEGIGILGYAVPLGPYGAEVGVTVRAVGDSGAASTGNVDVTRVTPDAAAPGAPTGLRGVAS